MIFHFFLDDELHDDVPLEAVAAAAVGHGVVAVKGDAASAAPALPAVHDGAVAAVGRLTDLRIVMEPTHSVKRCKSHRKSI